MSVITVERLTTAQALVNKMVEQSKFLFEDIAETAKDRARLASELEQSNSMIDQLTVEARQLMDRVNNYEQCNSRLLEELNLLESKLADATARLESISHTARLDPPSNHSNGGPSAGAAAGLAALKSLSAPLGPAI